MSASSPALNPLIRLLWKEHRTQRMLWLAMFALGLVLQVIVCIRGRGQFELAVWSLAALIPVLFMIASTAVVFAGEREEGTCEWLVRLSAPPTWILTAKWGYVLLASTSISLFLSITAILLVGRAPVNERRTTLESIGELLLPGLGFMIWCSFGSLVSRRVVTSIPAMFFWWLVTMIGTVFWVPFMLGYRESGPMPGITKALLTLVFIGVGAADLWLGLRWCRGNYVDATILNDLNQKWIAWQNRILRRSARTSRLPLGMECQYASWRIWQRLVWQERHRESYHTILLGIGIVSALLFGAFSWACGESLMLSLPPVVIALPLVVGILSFRYDTEGQPLRFLANRGVSPAAIWCAKQAVWIPRAFWIPLVVWVTGCIAEQLFVRVDSTIRPLARFQFLGPTAVEGLSKQHALLALSFDVWNHIGMVAWFVLLSYGCGHLSAMLMRRVILSVVLGVTLTGIATFWLLLMFLMEAPTLFLVGGVVVWLFGLSLWFARYWLMERRSRPMAIRLGVNVLIPFVCLIAATAIFRASEVAGFGPSLPWTYVPRTADGQSLLADYETLYATTILPAEIARQSEPFTPEDLATIRVLNETQQGFDRWNLLRDEVLPNENREELLRHDKQTNERLKQRFLEINAERIKRILAAIRDEHRVVKDAGHGSVSDWSRQRTRFNLPDHCTNQDALLECTGDVLTEAGKLDEALDHYCGALRLARLWAGRGALDERWWAGSISQESTLSRLVEWSNHPDQTISRLNASILRVRHELEAFPSVKEAVISQYLHDRNVLEESVRVRWNRSTREEIQSPQSFWNALFADNCRFFPWEVIRAQRVLETQLIERYCIAIKATELLKRPGVDVTRVLDELQSPAWDLAYDAHVLRSTPLAKIAPRSDGEARHFQHIFQQVISREVRFTRNYAGREFDAPSSYLKNVLIRETAVRQTLIALAMQVWKRQRGEWPDSLEQLYQVRSHDDLLPALPPNCLVDPWNGKLFLFRDELRKLVNPWIGQKTLTWTAQTTLLISVGRHNPRVVYSEGPVAGDKYSEAEIYQSFKTSHGDIVSERDDDRWRLDFVGNRLVLVNPYIALMPPR